MPHSSNRDPFVASYRAHERARERISIKNRQAHSASHLGGEDSSCDFGESYRQWRKRSGSPNHATSHPAKDRTNANRITLPTLP